jgi:hypothetical protein
LIYQFPRRLVEACPPAISTDGVSRQQSGRVANAGARLILAPDWKPIVWTAWRVSPPAGFPEDLSPAIVEAIENVSARSSQYQEQHQRGVSS